MIRFLRFARYSRQLSRFTDTFRYAKGSLIGVTISLVLVFVGFIFLFHFLFKSTVERCANVLFTSQLLMQLLMLKAKTYDLFEAHPILAGLTLFLFFLFVIFVVINLFVSVISESFQQNREYRRHHLDEDHDMFALIWDRFRRWTRKNTRFVGSPFLVFKNEFFLDLRRLEEKDLYEENDRLMRIRYADAFECLPDKIDQLVEALRLINDKQESIL